TGNRLAGRGVSRKERVGMRMKAWVFQIANQIEKLGEQNASWYVGWLDPDGKRHSKSFGPGKIGKSASQQEQIKLHAELTKGTYQSLKKKTWADFRQEYHSKILNGMLPQTRRLVVVVLDDFERLINPKKIASVKTQTIDDFRAKRRIERGKKEGDLI